MIVSAAQVIRVVNAVALPVGHSRDPLGSPQSPSDPYTVINAVSTEPPFPPPEVLALLLGALALLCPMLFLCTWLYLRQRRQNQDLMRARAGGDDRFSLKQMWERGARAAGKVAGKAASGARRVVRAVRRRAGGGEEARFVDDGAEYR
jgi:hypothetical protein